MPVLLKSYVFYECSLNNVSGLENWKEHSISNKFSENNLSMTKPVSQQETVIMEASISSSTTPINDTEFEL